MPFDDHRNFAYSLIATAPSPASSGTSLIVTAGEGTRFPTPPFNATIWPTGALADPLNAEIVRVTAIATDTLTITRAQEASSARTVVVGDQIAATITDKVLTDIEAAVGSGGLTVLTSDVSVAEVVSSATETTVFTYTVPGGTLGTSGRLMVVMTMDVLNNSGSPMSCQVRLKYGGTVIAMLGTMSLATFATRRAGWFEAQLAAAGATNAQRSTGVATWGAVDSVANPVTPQVATSFYLGVNDSLAIDSTADQTLSLSFQNASSSALMSSRLHTIHVLKG